MCSCKAILNMELRAHVASGDGVVWDLLEKHVEHACAPVEDR